MIFAEKSNYLNYSDKNAIPFTYSEEPYNEYKTEEVKYVDGWVKDEAGKGQNLGGDFFAHIP